MQVEARAELLGAALWKKPVARAAGRSIGRRMGMMRRRWAACGASGAGGSSKRMPDSQSMLRSEVVRVSERSEAGSEVGSDVRGSEVGSEKHVPSYKMCP